MAGQDLEVLYQEAQSAFKNRDYDRASSLLRQILLIDENYRDTSRLLAQIVRLRRRRWYNDMRVWGMLIGIIVIGLLVWLTTTPLKALFVPPATSTATATSAPTLTPTLTPSPTPTPIPLVWRRVYVGQEFTRDTVAWFGMDSKDKDVLYVGMENAGTYQSIDGGLSWQPVNSAALDNITKFDSDLESSNEGYQFIRHTAADGKERIYYSTGYYGGWAVSENGGQNRREFYFGGNVTPAIAFSPNGEPYIQCDWNICKFSPDGKERITLGRPDIGAVEVIVVSPYDPNTIFVGGTGLAISTDGGLTWNKANNGLGATVLKLDNAAGPRGSFFLQMGKCLIDWFADPNRQNMEQPLYHSKDGGKTWNLLANEGCALSIDINGTTLYRHGVPLGVSWNPNPNSSVVTRASSIWRSQDMGETWQKQITGPSVYAMITNPFQSGEIMLFAGTDWFYTETLDRQFLSQNYGETWNTFNLTIENFDFGGGNTYALQYGPIPNLLYLIPRYQDMHRSEDNGIVWEQCSNPFDSNDIEKQLLIDPRDGRHLLIAQTLDTMFESRDGCDSWKAIAPVVSDQTKVNTLALDSNHPDTIYAGTDGGAYVSFDFGQTWNQINDGLLGATVVYSIVVDKDGNVYAATPYGIFKLETH